MILFFFLFLFDVRKKRFFSRDPFNQVQDRNGRGWTLLGAAVDRFSNRILVERRPEVCANRLGHGRPFVASNKCQVQE